VSNGTSIHQSEEAAAIARVAEAAREVQASSAALERHFGSAPGTHPGAAGSFHGLAVVLAFLKLLVMQ
jgi:hypothetical protein